MKAIGPLRILILLLVLSGTVGCDQTTKHLARTKLDVFNSITFMGGLGQLRLAENPGAFLSLGAAMSPTVRKLTFTIAAGLGLLALLSYLLVRPRMHWLTFVGLNFVLAGGVSNLIDRIMRAGRVTDFIILRCGPLQTGVFNVADIFVMIGVAILIFMAWKTPRLPQPTNPE